MRFVVLAERDHVDTDLVGQYRLVEHRADRLRMRDHFPVLVPGKVPEAVDAELDLRCIHLARLLRRPSQTD